MTYPAFTPNAPKLVQLSETKWEIQWDRAPEVDFIAAFHSTTEPIPRLIAIRNIDDANRVTLTDGLKRLFQARFPDRRLVSYQNITLANDVWQTFINSFYDTHKVLPIHLGQAYIKHSRYPFNNNRTIDSIMRRIANASASAFKDNREVTFAEVMKLLELEFSAPEPEPSLPIVSPPGDQDALFQSAFARGYAEDELFRSYLDNSVFLLRGTFAGLEQLLSPLQIPSFRAVMLQESKLSPPEIEFSKGGVPTLSASVIGVDEATNLIEPIWHDEQAGSRRSKAFVRLIIEERARNLSQNPAKALLLGENELSHIANMIRQAVGDATHLDSIRPKQSPIDADVVGDRLVLRDTAEPQSNTPAESIEAMRISYLEDAQRLALVLEGTNGAGAFLSRLQNAARTLSSRFTKVSSLILGDQARALEVMLPSMSEILTDVTASDIGAFVSGLGLLSRQFPEWRSFVEEARDTLPMSETDTAMLRRVAEVLETAADPIVEPRLKVAVAETREASGGLIDPVLDFAFVRTIGNVVRAIGRYLYDRVKGIGTQFNKTLDENLGKIMATTAIGAIFFALKDALLHLAVSLPLEFGWIIGLGLLILKSK